MSKTTVEDDYVVNISKRQYGKELDGCRCLNLCEARLILTDQLKANYPRSQQAQNVIRQAYDYAASFAKIKVRQAVLDLRSVLDKHGDLVEFEIACLVNLFPRSPDEAKFLIPSLTRLKDSCLSHILHELDSYRIFAA